MRIRFLGLAAVLAALVLISARPATAQGLASVVAATAATANTTVEKANCYGCGVLMGVQFCQAGFAQGYSSCSSTFFNLCGLSNPGCGAGAALPVDPDGASQYVSRGGLLGVLASADSPPTRQNCEGVVVARHQSPDDILTVRSRTGTLSL